MKLAETYRHLGLIFGETLRLSKEVRVRQQLGRLVDPFVEYFGIHERETALIPHDVRSILFHYLVLGPDARFCCLAARIFLRKSQTCFLGPCYSCRTTWFSRIWWHMSEAKMQSDPLPFTPSLLCGGLEGFLLQWEVESEWLCLDQCHVRFQSTESDPIGECSWLCLRHVNRLSFGESTQTKRS